MAKIAVTSSKKINSASSSTQKQEVERLAYQLFVDRGYEHGHDQEDWLRAEAIARSRRS